MLEPDICRYCFKKIKHRDELVTASRWGNVKPFHYLCYQEIQKETKVSWLSWKPLNGMEGNIAALFLAAVAVWLFATDTGGTAGDIVAVISVYPLVLRLTSYVVFERKVNHFRGG